MNPVITDHLSFFPKYPSFLCFTTPTQIRTMNLCQVSFALLFLSFAVTFAVGSNNPTHFTGDVSVNCGSSGTSAARNGREWLGDVQSRFSSLLQIDGISTTSTVIHKSTSFDPVPHKTARISLSQFSYAFQVNPGQKIIRLHFNPSPYKGFKGLKDLFTVEAGPFTLLGNFSASLAADALGVNSFAKEFCLNIQENQQLSITFSPESSQSLDTYAFINGIEIVSVPDSLSYFHGRDTRLQVVGQKSLVYVDNSTALEIIQRLNIKQDPIPSTGDFDDMFPKWAMQKVDKMKNNTWKIPVEVGFRYLIRLHFSELGIKIAGTGDVIFKVLINEMIAHTNTDILKARDENNILLYRDYMLTMRGPKIAGKRDILISLESYDELIDGHVILAGFEIVKLSNTDNSLASPNPLPPPQDSPSQTIRILLSVLGQRNAIETVAVAIICVINIIVYKLRKIWEASRTEEENKPSARAERLCRRFSLAEIQLATRNFNDGLLIGRGGFGKVYKGLIDKGQKTVAVKRLKPNSQQGAHEFLTEIETLSELRHINLVSLIGYCSERREMILVYEFMACGTLADHLYKLARDSSNSSSLTWKQRLNICIGAARGLDYLHTGHRIIHRDVKSPNILLDENFVAKVSDFGLAKPEDRSKLQSHVSTKVKGTRGYLDAHYINTCKLTRKSDIYAFGVVLFEVLCGRPAVDSEDKRLLSWWARDKISKGEVDQIVASSLREEITQNSLKTFVGVAERCLHDEPKNRPTMSQVVLQLEVALEQQESKQNLVLNEIASVSDDIRPSTSNDGIDLSSTAQPTMTTTDMQNLALPPNEQTNSNVVNAELTSGRKHGKKSTSKPSRLWPWDAFWNRFKTSKKNELLLSEEEICEADIKLAKFDWDTIAAATNHFSSLNKVGQGGFGCIYKAVLPTGQVVAVKRLSTYSREGLKEFKNEIVLLPNLQHRNIIKLLGYCIHREEKLLIYEFMENTSLDTFIDEEQRRRLLWTVRFKIIMGIARGLVYLHQDSGLRVIYRDLKLRNILLDIDMNPKISDFDFARTLVEHQYELETTEIVETTAGYYMPPEYVMQGKFSVKSDVYSFGIIVLEIVSGRRVWNSAYSETMMFLPSYAWKLWYEGKALNLVDNLLGGAFSSDQALRCIQVGLLCTQQDPNYRPEMPSVLKILEGEQPQVELRVELQDPGHRREDLTSGNVHTNELISNATFESCEVWVDSSIGGSAVEAPDSGNSWDGTSPALSGINANKFVEFSYEELANATKDFSIANKIGEGGFSSVYYAELRGEKAAIKKMDMQASKEFLTELNVFTLVHHLNVERLIGYCVEGSLFLVYEYIENGNLSQHLRGSGREPLPWSTRIQIALDSARGLEHIHEHTVPACIHRNIKPASILIDKNFHGKVASLSLTELTEVGSFLLQAGRLVGTFGYMPPQYAQYDEVSPKVDVYAFGVVMYELISAKEVIVRETGSAADSRSLVALFEEVLSKPDPSEDLKKLVDPRLGDSYPLDSVLKLAQLARACTHDNPQVRPSMRSVVVALNFLLISDGSGNQKMHQD